MKRIFQLFPIFIIALTVVGFFYKSVFLGLIPAPTDTLIGLYHPWRDLYYATNPRGVPFKNFLITDPIRQQIPWRKIAIDQWKIGDIPAWNPYSFLGTPLAANIQTGAYQPANILFRFFDFPVAWTFVVALQSFFGALFLFIYLRNLKLSAISAYFGATVWTFCGFFVAWLTWGTIAWTALCIPLLLYEIDKVERVLKDKKASFAISLWSVSLGLTGALMIASGHAQVALYGLLIASLYGLYRFWGISNRRGIALYIVVSMIVLLLGSYVVWKPFIQFYVLTARSVPINLSNVAGWLLPFQHLLQLLAPDFFGNPSTLNYYGVWNYGEFIGYVGVIPLVLAGSALFLGGVVTFWSLVLVVSLVLMIDSPLTHMLYSMHIPIYSSLQPTRLMVLVDLSLAIVASFGLEAVLTKKITRLTKSFGIISVFFLIVLLSVLYREKMVTDAFIINNLSVAKRNLMVPMMIFLSLGSLLFLHKTIKKFKASLLVGILIVLSILDLFRFGWKFTPFTPKEYFFPRTNAIAFLQSQQKPFRVMSLDDRILPPNTSAYFGIETIEGYDPLYPNDYALFFNGSDIGKETTLQRIFTLHDLNNPILPYLNAKYVLSLTEINNRDFEKVFEEGETKVYQYMKSFPRVYIARGEKVYSDEYSRLALQKLRESIVEDAIVESSKGVKDMPLLPDEFISIISYSDNAITIKTRVNVSRILVVLNRYDTGWNVTVDGVSSTLFKANGLFQGVVVGAGEHTVKLWYQTL